ncbi:hypothetical protein FD755_018878 [Muntiacus reevesi]|uniref:Uncharacterized protein n=1 Tax=Muntiacus reevesi TaxID=9886 RepID=A0A5N3X836_MUNRE|nr:hypothetical protein FD755_018878 [Muntiacus reevesi]
MGEKVSEAPEPMPRGCSSHSAPTPAPAVAAESSPGASSAESSSGSETLSEEGEPGFSREQPPPPPPGGARPAAAWAPALLVPERGVSAPPPRPGGAAPPAPRGSSASQEEQDEETSFSEVGVASRRGACAQGDGLWAGSAELSFCISHLDSFRGVQMRTSLPLYTSSHVGGGNCLPGELTICPLTLTGYSV